jgi:signal transduction histidine kinase
MPTVAWRKSGALAPPAGVGGAPAKAGAGIPFAQALPKARYKPMLDTIALHRVAPGRSRPAASAFPLESTVRLQHRTLLESLVVDARVVAAVLLCIIAAPPSGLFHSLDVIGWTIGYAGWALAASVSVRSHPALLLRTAGALHAVDVLWACCAGLVLGGVNGNVFPLCVFPIAAAAYRSNLKVALLEGLLILVCATIGSAHGLVGIADFVASPTWVLEVAYVVVGAVLFGVISHRLHSTTFEGTTIAQLVRHIERSRHLTDAVRSTLSELLRVFDAAQAIVVVKDGGARALLIWRAAAAADGRIEVTREQRVDTEASEWIGVVPPNIAAFELRRRSDEDKPATTLALDTSGELAAGTCEAPAPILGQPWRTLIGAVIETDTPWTGVLVLLDPAGKWRGDLRLHSLHVALQRTVPPLVSLYLQQRVRSRAESLERGRIARELHDGPVQSLAAIEMRLDVLARRVGEPSTAEELTTVRDLVHDESMNLRDLMMRLRHSDVTPQRLRGELRDLVSRFSAFSGIRGQVSWHIEHLDLTPRACREVLRIVQEALVNVRRHSRATDVAVAVQPHAGGCLLTIADNGGGFGFTGRITLAEMEGGGIGPRIIRDRVAALGGALTLESGPTGARLSIVLPARACE